MEPLRIDLEALIRVGYHNDFTSQAPRMNTPQSCPTRMNTPRSFPTCRLVATPLLTTHGGGRKVRYKSEADFLSSLSNAQFSAHHNQKTKHRRPKTQPMPPNSHAVFHLPVGGSGGGLGGGWAGLGRGMGWGRFAWAAGTSTPFQCSRHGCTAKTTLTMSRRSRLSTSLTGQTHAGHGACKGAAVDLHPTCQTRGGGLTLQHLIAFRGGRRCVQQSPTTMPTRRSSKRPA